jgi:uncharacterized protein
VACTIFRHFVKIAAMALAGTGLTPLANAETLASTAEVKPDTAYPGGRWEPGPARYGVEVVTHLKVTMDDGVVLDAAAAYPTDLKTGQRATERFPVIIEDTPYVTDDIPPNHTPGPVDSYYAHYGYISVRVNSRGTGASTGVHGFWSPREAKDGAALVDWAAHRLEGGDGRVALLGCSFPGGNALDDAAAVGPNSSLKAVVAACIALGSVQRHDILLSGVPGQDIGFLYRAAQQSMGGQPATVRFYHDFADEILRGGDAAYDRDFWTQRLPLGAADRIVANHVPVLLWTGWKDFVGIGALRTYSAFQNATAHRSTDAPMITDQATSARYQIVVGDWTHGIGLDEGIMLQWFDTWVKGVDTGLQATSTPMHLFEVETGRWINAAHFPLTDDYTSRYLRDGGLLADQPSTTAARGNLAFGPSSAANGRLSFTTTAFHDGATLSGPVAATLYARSSNSNLLLIARLSDIAPNGQETLVTKGVILGSQRALDPARSWVDKDGRAIWPWQSLKRDEFLSPGQDYRLDVHLEPRQWAILPGHRLRLALTTQAPPSTCPGMDKKAYGNDPCYLTAVQKATLPGGHYAILYGGQHASRINLPLLPLRSLPETDCRVTPTSDGVCLPHQWQP